MGRGDLRSLGTGGKIKFKTGSQNCVGLLLSQEPVAHSSDHGDEALDSIKEGEFLYQLDGSLWRKTYWVPHVMKHVVIYCALYPCYRLDAFRCAW
jgi:hypothetical protein